MSGTDKSTLEISVITTGLSGNGGAPAQLNKLGEAAGKAEPKVAGLLATIEKLMKQQQSATAVALQYTQAIQGSNASLGGGSANAGSLATATKKLAEAMLVLSGSMQTVQTRTGSAQVALTSYIGTMKDGQAAARGFAGSLGALWTTYGNAIPLAAGLAIGASMKGIITVGKDVEHTLEGVRVRGQESLASIDAMRQTVMDLGKGVYGPQEVAKALETMILAGLSAEKAMAGVRDALNLATVGGTTIEKSAEVLVQVGTALDYDANAYGRIADVISMTAAASMSSVESVSESFKAGSVVGKMYGATIEDIGAEFAMLSNLGIKGSAAGTAVKNFYSFLSSGAEKVTKTLKDMGLTMDDLKDSQGNFRGIEEVMGTLSDGLDKLTESQQKLAIANLSNERGAKVLVEGLSLVRKATGDTTNALSDLVKKVDESFGYAAVGAAAMALTIDSQFKSVKNTLQTQFLGAFQDIQPQLSVVASALKAAFNSPEFAKGIQGIALTLADLAVALAENIGLLKTVFELFLAWKAVGFVASLILGIAEAIMTLKTAMEASRIAALALQASLGILVIALTAAAAAWVWYHNKKDNVNADYKASIAYMDDFTGKLNEEATRLEKQLELMQKGKTAREAETTAIRDQQLALVQLNGEKAVASQVAKVVEAKDKLSPSELRSLERAHTLGATAINNLPAVNAVLAAERGVASAISDTNTKREEAVKAQERVVAVSKKIADLAAQQSKDAQSNPNAGTGVLTPKEAKGRAGPDLEKKENEEFARRMEQMTVGIAQAKEMIEGYRELGAEYNKLTEGGKLLLKYKYELGIAQKMELDSVNALRIGHLKTLIAEAERLEFDQKLAQFQKDKFASAEALQKDTDNRIRSIEQEAAGIQRKADAYGLLKGATDLEIANGLELQKNMLVESGITGQVIIDLEREIAARRALSEAKGNLAVVKNNADALEAMNKALDPSKAFQFGDGFEKAFGKIGKAIDGVTKSYDAYGKKMKDTAKSAEGLNDIKDLKTYVKARDVLNTKSKKDEMDMYGDMAGAAKGYFKEKTLAYKILDATEKGFRIAAMALAFVEMEQKMAYIAAVTAAKTTAAGVEGTVDAALTAESVTNSGIKATASAGAGVAKAFEQLGVYGFVGAAAILAFLMSMGISSGGGGASMPSISEQRQKTQGTGTVLGSEDAKSESIKNSLATLADNSDITLPYTSKMLMALKNIEAGIGGMANFVARSTGLRGTQADQNALGVGSSKGTWGFSSSSTELQDSGILLGNQSIGDAMKGINASSYADVHKESSSWWGLSKSSSNEEMLGALDPALSKQITMTIGDMVKGVTTAAEALGKSGPQVTAQLQSMTIAFQRISLKGLSGDDLVKELEAVFSQIGDMMAENIFGNLQDFQKVGEGLLETATRVATGVEQAKVALSGLGLTAVGLYDVTYKQGDVGAEIVRKTLTNQERYTQLIISWQGWYSTVAYGALNGIGEIIETMDGSASDLIETYKQLIAVRDQMKSAGLGENLNRDWVTGAGGLDNLSSGMSDFIDGMFTDAEKLQMQTNSMTASFAKLGYKLPATAQAFKELVQSVAASGNGDLAGKLIVLSGGFNDLQSALKDVADAAAEAADQAAQDAKDAREKLLSDAHDNLSAAYDKEKQALTDTQSKFEDFAKSLRSFRDGLMTGASSPGTPADKYAAAAANYASTSALAKTGDKDAISKFQEVANTFLQLSRDYNASGDAYTQDFNRVMTESGMLADYADKQVDVATASLDALNKQVTGLVDVKEATLSVQVAIMQLYDAMVLNQDTTKYNAMSGSLMQQYAGQSDPGSISMYSSMMANGASYQMVADAITKAYPMDGSHANGLGYVPFDGYRAELHEGEAVLTASENKQYQLGLSGKSDNGALVNELKGLRDEVKQLKEEQRQQTQAMIGSNYDAQSAAACKVVDGVGEALSQSARTASVKPSLN